MAFDQNTFYIFPTTFMLGVSFSPVPECVVSDCWKRPFRTPPCHQSPVIVVVLYPGFAATLPFSWLL